MVYTINSGLQRHLKERYIKGGGVALPVVALVFLLLAAFSFSSYHSAGQQPYIPAKSQTTALNSTDNSGNNSTGNQTAPSTSAPPSVQPALSLGSSPSGSIASSPAPSSLTSGGSTPTGGMGGGDPTPLTPQPTVACTNLLTLSQICTACTPPLTLQPGQKALLSSDGTCVAVN